MALLEIPVWTIPPDWADPVNEELEWKTSILASIVGAEQRQSLRLSPRRALEYTVRPTGAWRTYYDALLSTAFQVEFYTPLWHDRGTLAADVGIGDTTFTIVGDRTELATMAVAFIPSDRPYLYDIVEITSVSVVGGNTVFVCGALANAWEQGNPVFAAGRAAITTQPSFTRMSDNVLESVVRFDLLQANDWAEVPSLPSYRTFPVMDLETNEKEGQSGSYFRFKARIDNEVGIPLAKDFGGIGFPGFGGSNFVHGLVDSVALRTLLYSLRGRRNAAWFVYPTADFTMFHSITSGSTSLVVDRSGFTDLGGPTVGRQDIRIRLKDGTTFYRRIDGSGIQFDQVSEHLTLDTALGVAVSPGDVSRISFMGIGRLDQDLITLSHVTDTEGVCSTSLAYKLMPHLRDASDWTPPAFPFTAMEHCTIPSEPRPTGVVINSLSVFGGAFAGSVLSHQADDGNFGGEHGTFMMSVWVEASGDGEGIRFFSNAPYPAYAGPPFDGGEDGTQNNLVVTMGGSQILCTIWTPDFVQIGLVIFPPLTPGRHNVIMSMSSTANLFKCAVDDVIIEPSTEVWLSAAAMGSQPLPIGSQDVLSAAGSLPVCVNDFWASRTPSYVDITIGTNRRAFINGDFTPTNLPDDGEALGIVPDIYLAISTGDDPSVFCTNKGSGTQFETGINMDDSPITSGLHLCEGF